MTLDQQSSAQHQWV